MKGYREIDAKSVEGNLIKKIGEEWMLVSAGGKEGFNTMTASWGGVGVLWGKSVAFVFIRPQRHTFGYTEKNDGLTLTFFGEGKQREALQICGTKSGRDCDKVAEASLTPIFTPSGNPAFAEGEIIMECKKLYSQDLAEECFIDKSLVEKWFAAKDFHKMYVCEIERVYIKE